LRRRLDPLNLRISREEIMGGHLRGIAAYRVYMGRAMPTALRYFAAVRPIPILQRSRELSAIPSVDGSPMRPKIEPKRCVDSLAVLMRLNNGCDV